MGKVKYKRGVVFVDGKDKNTQTGSDNIASFEDAHSEQAKCDPCGCDSCLCYDTVCSATTGEILVRYYTGALGGPYTRVVEPLAAGLINLQALYDAR